MSQVGGTISSGRLLGDMLICPKMGSGDKGAHARVGPAVSARCFCGCEMKPEPRTA